MKLDVGFILGSIYLELNVGLIDQVNFLKHMSSLKGCSLAQVWVKVLGDMVVSEICIC